MADYPIVVYSSQKKAKEAFLEAYFGNAGFKRQEAAKIAGLAYPTVASWFEEPSFFAMIENRLQNQVKRKNSLQDQLMEEAQYILTADISDMFDQNEDGSLSVKNIKTLPRTMTAAIKQMEVVQTVAPGQRRGQFTDALRIILHDKVAAMRLVGDYTNIKENALKTTETGRPAMVGMSLITTAPQQALENKDGEGHDTDGDGGQIQHDTGPEDKSD